MTPGFSLRIKDGLIFNSAKTLTPARPEGALLFSPFEPVSASISKPKHAARRCGKNFIDLSRYLIYKVAETAIR